MSEKDRVRIEGPSDDELKRVRALLSRIGGPNVVWGAKQVLDLWVIEARLEADRQSARRMLAATWVLAVATVALVIATVALVVVALGE